MKLRDYAGGGGQWGEVGMIAECFNRLGIQPESVAEFGAGGDPGLLNTVGYANEGAPTLWAESDPARRQALITAVAPGDNVTFTRDHVADVDAWLATHGFRPDLLSIDVDGLDYQLFAQMTMRPAVVVIEHHPMIPAHVSYVGGPDIGCSALALVELAATKGYSLVGTTHANCIFVDSAWADRFDDLDTDLASIFDPSAVTFAVSNVATGDYNMIGPWPFGRSEELV